MNDQRCRVKIYLAQIALCIFNKKFPYYGKNFVYILTGHYIYVKIKYIIMGFLCFFSHKAYKFRNNAI